jgi:hypothetical protein
VLFLPCPGKNAPNQSLKLTPTVQRVWVLVGVAQVSVRKEGRAHPKKDVRLRTGGTVQSVLAPDALLLGAWHRQLCQQRSLPARGVRCNRARVNRDPLWAHEVEQSELLVF